MPNISQERREVMRLIVEPPKRLTQDRAQTCYDIECGNGPKILRIARRVCTLHNAWADMNNISNRQRKILDNRLVQASMSVKTLLECHHNKIQIGCNIKRVEDLQSKITDRLLTIRNR